MLQSFIVVTGLSGSGKSIALRVLEDNGYYCIDNLPVDSLQDVLSCLDKQQTHIAISIDSRSLAIESLQFQLAKLRQFAQAPQILFLQASTACLLKRFSETRRKHPLSTPQNTLTESIEQEKLLLAPLQSYAQHIIDTSEISATTLRQWVKDLIAMDTHHLAMLFISFGFKHGLPSSADIVFDVRCLPNPYHDALLRPQSGLDEAVRQFFLGEPLVKSMCQDIIRYLETWLPLFLAENRSYLTVAIGCTGGQHRSVYVAECLHQHFSTTQRVLIRHRELSLSLP